MWTPSPTRHRFRPNIISFTYQRSTINRFFKVRNFTDDCLIYKQIKNNNDQIELQRDLNLLDSWRAKWGMRFNTAKCNIMRVSRKRSTFLHSYTLSGQVLGEVEDTKYLGVTLRDNLDWSKHITTTTTKANAGLSFIKRNLKDCPKTKELAVSLVLLGTFLHGLLLNCVGPTPEV